MLHSVCNPTTPESVSRLSVQTNNIPTCKKIVIAVLTFFALTAITAIVLSIVTICGGFPFLLAALNTVTIGASVSLPVFTCIATTLLLLCLRNIELLTKPQTFIISTKFSPQQ
ncbi:inclusion membrane protein B [Chlamydia suis MD56]|uniref:inclusion membrane protein IncB n=1 Tax=Chlamydia suis TaxID=83559 RepID=UPI0003BFF3AD|nr:inclusion membrane protein IncB [Chlamydia suis]ESN89541.1 inclusion membrane protein B [Chlamydia suis MD56]